MDTSIDFMPDEPLRSVVIGWEGKLSLAVQHRKPWMDVADQCMKFFCASTGFLWDEEFQTKFLKGNLAPRFRMTLNKAFELVAVFGPSLYWKNPQRAIRSRKPIDIDPQLFGPANDPVAQMLFEQAQQEIELKSAEDKARAQLLEQYLNYTPLEQPGGGLARHSQRAITEALVKGRGCLWVEPYQYPGSDSVLTGCFADRVDNLLIDPDARSLDEAKWIAKRCVHPVWQVEREYGYKPGELQEYANTESAEVQGESMADRLANTHRSQGKTFDQITYYKIWSKGGVGTRFTETADELKTRFDEVVGDYAYIVIAKGMPFPLNAPWHRVETASADAVRKMFEWPVPYWLDNRWPVAVLDFYEHPDNPWPIAPMAPALGELTFMNIMIAHLANRIWSSSRDIVCVRKSAAPVFKAQYDNGKDLAIVELDDVNFDDIDKVVKVLQFPQTNMDAWRIVELVSDVIEQRTGLSEYFYGRNPGGVQSRTAEDARNKAQSAGVRPDYMASQVEKWQTETARMEKLCMRWNIKPKDIVHLSGRTGAYLYEKLITTQDPAVIVREMDCTVEAGSVRKPNKERETENINQVGQILYPLLQEYAAATGNTQPLNELLRKHGDAIDQDMSGLQLGEWLPEQQSQAEQEAMQMQMQMQQQQAEMEQQRLAMEMEAQQQKTQAEVLGKMIDIEAKKIEIAMKRDELELKRQAGEMELEQSAQQMQMEQAGFLQQLRQGAATHQQKMQQQQATGSQQLKLQKQAAEQKAAQQKAAAKAKPKARPKAGAK